MKLFSVFFLWVAKRKYFLGFFSLVFSSLLFFAAGVVGYTRSDLSLQVPDAVAQSGLDRNDLDDLSKQLTKEKSDKSSSSEASFSKFWNLALVSFEKFKKGKLDEDGVRIALALNKFWGFYNWYKTHQQFLPDWQDPSIFESFCLPEQNNISLTSDHLSFLKQLIVVWTEKSELNLNSQDRLSLFALLQWFGFKPESKLEISVFADSFEVLTAGVDCFVEEHSSLIPTKKLSVETPEKNEEIKKSKETQTFLVSDKQLKTALSFFQERGMTLQQVFEIYPYFTAANSQIILALEEILKLASRDVSEMLSLLNSNKPEHKIFNQILLLFAFTKLPLLIEKEQISQFQATDWSKDENFQKIKTFLEITKDGISSENLFSIGKKMDQLFGLAPAWKKKEGGLGLENIAHELIDQANTVTRAYIKLVIAKPLFKLFKNAEELKKRLQAFFEGKGAKPNKPDISSSTYDSLWDSLKKYLPYLSKYGYSFEHQLTKDLTFDSGLIFAEPDWQEKSFSQLSSRVKQEIAKLKQFNWDSWRWEDTSYYKTGEFVWDFLIEAFKDRFVLLRKYAEPLIRLGINKLSDIDLSKFAFKPKPIAKFRQPDYNERSQPYYIDKCEPGKKPGWERCQRTWIYPSANPTKPEVSFDELGLFFSTNTTLSDFKAGLSRTDDWSLKIFDQMLSELNKIKGFSEKKVFALFQETVIKFFYSLKRLRTSLWNIFPLKTFLEKTQVTFSDFFDSLEVKVISYQDSDNNENTFPFLDFLLSLIEENVFDKNAKQLAKWLQQSDSGLLLQLRDFASYDEEIISRFISNIQAKLGPLWLELREILPILPTLKKFNSDLAKIDNNNSNYLVEISDNDFPPLLFEKSLSKVFTLVELVKETVSELSPQSLWILFHTWQKRSDFTLIKAVCETFFDRLNQFSSQNIQGSHWGSLGYKDDSFLSVFKHLKEDGVDKIVLSNASNFVNLNRFTDTDLNAIDFSSLSLFAKKELIKFWGIDFFGYDFALDQALSLHSFYFKQFLNSLKLLKSEGSFDFDHFFASQSDQRFESWLIFVQSLSLKNVDLQILRKTWKDFQSSLESKLLEKIKSDFFPIWDFFRSYCVFFDIFQIRALTDNHSFSISTDICSKFVPLPEEGVVDLFLPLKLLQNHNKQFRKYVFKLILEKMFNLLQQQEFAVVMNKEFADISKDEHQKVVLFRLEEAFFQKIWNEVVILQDGLMLFSQKDFAELRKESQFEGLDLQSLVAEVDLASLLADSYDKKTKILKVFSHLAVLKEEVNRRLQLLFSPFWEKLKLFLKLPAGSNLIGLDKEKDFVFNSLLVFKSLDKLSIEDSLPLLQKLKNLYQSRELLLTEITERKRISQNVLTFSKFLESSFSALRLDTAYLKSFFALFPWLKEYFAKWDLSFGKRVKDLVFSLLEVYFGKSFRSLRKYLPYLKVARINQLSDGNFVFNLDVFWHLDGKLSFEKLNLQAFQELKKFSEKKDFYFSNLVNANLKQKFVHFLPFLKVHLPQFQNEMIDSITLKVSDLSNQLVVSLLPLFRENLDADLTDFSFESLTELNKLVLLQEKDLDWQKLLLTNLAAKQSAATAAQTEEGMQLPVKILLSTGSIATILLVFSGLFWWTKRFRS